MSSGPPQEDTVSQGPKPLPPTDLSSPPNGLRLGAVVLAGGLSRRMGSPKSDLPFDKHTMLAHIVGIVQQVATSVVVSSSQAAALSSLPPGVSIARDRVAGRGPIEGLAVGLSQLVHVANAAIVVACDTPLVTPAFLRQLAAAYTTRASGSREPLAVVVRDAERRHPLPALYHLDSRTHIEQAIQNEQFRLEGLLEELAAIELPIEDLVAAGTAANVLLNVNDPDSYRAALANWRRRE